MALIWCVAASTVFLRFYMSRRLRQQHLPSDVTILLSLVASRTAASTLLVGF